MNLQEYNSKEIPLLQQVLDDLKWLLGEELGTDPRNDPKALVELENRLARWLLAEGGAMLREQVQRDQGKENNLNA